MECGRLRVEGGALRVDSGRWRVERGGSSERVQGGERRVKRKALPHSTCYISLCFASFPMLFLTTTASRLFFLFG